MKNLRRIAAILLALALLCSFAGCGGDSDKDDTAGDGFVKDSQIEMPKYDIKSDKVYMLTWEDPSVLVTPSAYMYTVNEKMKQEYGVSLEFIRCVNTELEIKAAQLVLSGNSPDLITLRDRDYPNFVYKGIAQPWDDYIDFSHPLFEGIKDVNDKYRIDGKVYRYFNTWFNNGYTWYWVNDFIEAGLETPRQLYYKGEWTWSKLDEYAKALTVKDTTGTVSKYGVGYEEPMHLVTGQTYIKDDGNGQYVNNLQNAALADFFNYAAEQGFSTKVRPTVESCYDLFKQGKVSMLVFEQYYGSNHLLSERLAGDVEFAPAPKWDGADKYYTPGRGTGGWLAMGAKNPAEAAAFMATWRLCSGKVDPIVIEAQKVRDTALAGCDEEDFALIDEMNDPAKFEILPIIDEGLGITWSSTEKQTFRKDVLWYNKPWATAIQEYSPLLNTAIKQTAEMKTEK
ncbi:MAG: hypothetical protein J6B93_05130 [Clostridia bacterium]|nr:hypothetical protein [Clostridia bacterium]